MVDRKDPNLKDPVKMINAAKTGVSVGSANKSFVGHLFLFQYDPKLAKVLPYWDKFPLVFPIDVKAGSMLGINMHYLPITLRLTLLNNLKKLIDKQKKTFININYDMIESQDSLRYAVPCIKRYLFSHFQSRLVPVGPEDWDLVIAAPLDDFQKAGRRKVWADSSKKVQ